MRDMIIEFNSYIEQHTVVIRWFVVETAILFIGFAKLYALFNCEIWISPITDKIFNRNNQIKTYTFKKGTQSRKSIMTKLVRGVGQLWSYKFSRCYHVLKAYYISQPGGYVI